MHTRLLATAMLAGIVLVAGATAALGHPGFRPDEVPAGGPVRVELVVPHGCGTEGDAAGSPTVEVAVQQSDRVVVVPSDAPGWATFTSDGAAGWRAAGGATADELVLPATVEVDAPIGEGLDLAVYQECADGDSVRWAAAEGEDGDPAVRLAVAAGTPSPLPTPVAPSPTAAPSPSGSPVPEPTPSVAPSTETPDPATPAPATPTAATPGPGSSTSPTPSDVPSLLATEDDGSGAGAGLAAAVAAAIAALAGGAWLLNRGGGDDADVAEGQE